MEQKQCIGLDTGQAVVKAVVLTQKGRSGIQQVEMKRLDCRTEGILSEEELCAELPGWFDQNQWKQRETVVSIPQFLGTTQVTDFPPRPADEMAQMVQYETQHLAGLSEETFIHGFQQMPPGHGRQNPAFIGVCRETMIEERAERFASTGIRICDFGLSGAALAGAYYHLYPEAKQEERLEILLEIGAENTTLLVLLAGQVLFAGSLMYGMDQYFQGVAAQLGITEEEARLRVENVAPEEVTDASSAFCRPLQEFAGEVRNALEQWQSHENAEVTSIPMRMISVCGGGAKLQGMDAFLGELLDCDARTVGVPVDDSDEIDPQLVCAYGLALQGLGVSPFSISLAPSRIKMQTQRRRRFKFFAAACVLLLLVASVSQAYTYVSATRKETRLEEFQARLNECKGFVDELDVKQSKIEIINHMLLPLAEKGNHSHDFLKILQELGRAQNIMMEFDAGSGRDIEGWFVYIADKTSFERGKKQESVEKSSGGSSRPRSPFASNWRREKKQDTPAAAFINLKKQYTHQIEPWKTFIAAFFTTQLANNRSYDIAQEVKEALKNGPPNGGEPIIENKPDYFMVEKDFRARESDVLGPWDQAFRGTRLEGRFRSWKIRLPLARQNVYVPAKPEKGGRK